MEERNADYWLQEETKPKIQRILINEMVTKHAEAVGDKETGTTYMLENNKHDQLALMYKCFNRDPGVKPLIINKMKAYSEKKGKACVEDNSNLLEPLKYVQALLDLKLAIDNLIEHSFDNDTKF